jgi:hypothetical protein
MKSLRDSWQMICLGWLPDLNPAFGNLSNAEWDAFNLRHCEMLMSFVVPNQELA